MKNIKIPVIIEQSYKNSIWCCEILDGIGRQNYCDADMNELTSFEENSVLLLVGSSNYFLSSGVTACLKNGLRPVVVGADFGSPDQNVSSIIVDRASATSEIVRYCKSLGRTPAALFGISRYSNADSDKKEAFVKASKSFGLDFSDDDIFCFDDGSTNCIEAFLKKAKKYKAVICSNDYFATALMFYAVKAGIKIPDDLFVIGYGNSPISKIVNPPLTTIAPKYGEMGAQAAKIYSYLSSNVNVNRVSVLIDYDIIIRESTSGAEKPNESRAFTESFMPCTSSIFDDGLIKKITALDTVIHSADETTLKILKGIAEGVSYDKLAEKLFLSDTAFRYRLNKIYSLTYCNSRRELKDILQIIF